MKAKPGFVLPVVNFKIAKILEQLKGQGYG